jgi:outer membrane protein assembly factor BamB
MMKKQVFAVAVVSVVCALAAGGGEDGGQKAGRAFVYAAEGAKKIVMFDAQGKVTWEYPAEMSRDVWRLANGNVLFCYNNNYNSGKNDNPSGVIEVTPEKREVFHFKTTGQVWSCQRMRDGRTLVGAASQGKLLIVDAGGAVAKEIKLKSAGGHSCLRNAREVGNGNFLVAEEGARAAREYDADGKLVREIAVDFPPYSVLRLANGNTVICGKQTMVEVDGAGTTLWKLQAQDIPEMGVRWFAGLQALPGGGFFVCNAGGKTPFFELSAERTVTWQWTGAAAPIGHGIQVLDVAGEAVK